MIKRRGDDDPVEAVVASRPVKTTQRRCNSRRAVEVDIYVRNGLEIDIENHLLTDQELTSTLVICIVGILSRACHMHEYTSSGVVIRRIRKV